MSLGSNFVPRGWFFLYVVKELAVWEGFGSCLVIIATATIPKSIEDFGTINICLENISVGMVCHVLLLNMC